jgi:hypothetical protein
MKIGDPESKLTFQLEDDGAHVYEIDQPACRMEKSGYQDLITGQDMYHPVATDPRPYTVLVERF